jgi:hypothetical protein
MIRMKGHAGAAFSPAPGETYTADAEGVLVLPPHHAAAAERHGFARLSEPAAARLIHAGFGRYFAHDDRGRRLNDKPLPKDAAAALLAAVAE